MARVTIPESDHMYIHRMFAIERTYALYALSGPTEKTLMFSFLFLFSSLFFGLLKLILFCCVLFCSFDRKRRQINKIYDDKSESFRLGLLSIDVVNFLLTHFLLIYDLFFYQSI